MTGSALRTWRLDLDGFATAPMHETASRTPVCMQACMYICTCMCMMMMTIVMVMSVVLATMHRIVNATRSHDKKAFASLRYLHCGKTPLH